MKERERGGGGERRDKKRTIGEGINLYENGKKIWNDLCRGNDPRLRNDGLRGEAKLLDKNSIDFFFIIYSSRDLFDALFSEITKLNPVPSRVFPDQESKSGPHGARGSRRDAGGHWALSRNASPNVEIFDKLADSSSVR